jgi:hypothetical protein
MEYRQFILKAFEREPGKWRASVQRANGLPISSHHRGRLRKFVTGTDASTAEAAALMAVAAIDASAFSQSPKVGRRKSTPQATVAIWGY